MRLGVGQFASAASRRLAPRRGGQNAGEGLTQEGFPSMDAVDRTRRTRPRMPAIEGLEGRSLLATALPDIAMVAASTSDSRGVTFDYDVNNAAVNQPVHFEVDRSATSQPGVGAEVIGGVDIRP